MIRPTLEDLAALTRTESEIKALPQVGDATTAKGAPLVDSPEYASAQQWAQDLAEYQAECGGGDKLKLSTCTGERVMCTAHTIKWLVFVGEQVGAARGLEAPLDPCPDGCGKPHILCWVPVAINLDGVL